MFRRLGTSLTVVALLASACSGSTSSSSLPSTAGPASQPLPTASAASAAVTDPPVEAITLTFVGPEAPEAMAPVIAAFEAGHPGITVAYESVPFNDLNSIIQTRVGGGDPDPDIYTADQPRIAALVQRGLLQDITDAAGDISAIVIGSSIEASTVDGQLYALPISTSTQLLYYNKDLLDAAGIPIPSMDPADRLTWEVVKADAKKAQKGGAKYGLLWDQVNRYYQLQPLAESAGGGSGIDPNDPLKLDITNAGWIKAMDYYGSIFADGLGPRGVPVEQTTDLFANGDVAFFVGGPWWLPKFDGADGLTFGVAPHPYFAGGEAVTPTGAWSWGVNPNSDKVDAAVEFIKYAALDPEGALATAQGFPLPPANKSVFDTYYAKNQVVPGVETLISAELADTSRIRPRSIGYIQFEEIMGQAFEDIRNGEDAKTTLESAASDIAKAWERLP